MVKILGAVLVVLSLTLLGEMKARAFDWRLNQLRQLQQGLRLLLTEISYSATLLPFALVNVGARLDKPVSELFVVTARLMRQNAELPVYDCWRRAAALERPKLSLEDKDLLIIDRLGKVLGQTDIAGQVKQLELALQQPDLASAEARDRQQKSAKMWRYLGFLGGLLLVIILV